MSGVELLIALAIAFGLAGVLLPILPGGSLLIGIAIGVWAYWQGSSTAWTVFAIAAVAIAAGFALKFLIPGRRLSELGIPLSTQLFGAGVGVVGFFVIPVVGLFLGFPLGVYLAEIRRVGRSQAGASTAHALKAIGTAILIELAAAIIAIGAYVTGVFAT